MHLRGAHVCFTPERNRKFRASDRIPSGIEALPAKSFAGAATDLQRIRPACLFLDPANDYFVIARLPDGGSAAAFALR
jgi:hypothetical protein